MGDLTRTTVRTVSGASYVFTHAEGDTFATVQRKGTVLSCTPEGYSHKLWPALTVAVADIRPEIGRPLAMRACYTRFGDTLQDAEVIHTDFRSTQVESISTYVDPEPEAWLVDGALTA